ncbi:prolipoprotein diacylglyceryl transferase [Actinocorallia populi]|uniref:prolipoprotein diacylglyceryl transferase n=1 Tax=Actinocorallia populi TaxID=2079200 RepID=UPI000D086D67|nr:prolipoprotein diacylglyceryl transferase [Actinocorallia populi]
MHLASIPSPSQGVWQLGPFPLRAYALMIIIGVVVAVWLGEKRWTAKGGRPGTVVDVAVWAVPFGLVGGRLYHVITDHQMYFGDGRDPLDALKVWNGGLGIWGAVALGAVGAWIGCRRMNVRLAPFADAVAPGIALAQAIGRWGNWWNQELYGKPTDLPWAVEIDFAHRPKDEFGAVLPQYETVGTYHPTFLYESLWCLALAIVVIWAGGRFNLNHGRSFALYVAGYTLGRGWIEALRIDPAHEFFGLRLNDYTAIVLFLAAAAYLYLNRGKAQVPEPLTLRPVPEDGAAEPADGGKEPVPAAAVPLTEDADEAKPAVPAEPETETVREPAPAEKAPEPVLEAEPVAEAEPVVEPAPVLEAEPVAEAEPVVEPEPVVEAEPVAEAESAVEPESVAEAEPVAEPESAVEPESVAEAEPVAEPESAVKPEPVVAEVPVAEEAGGSRAEDGAAAPDEDEDARVRDEDVPEPAEPGDGETAVKTAKGEA